jgi:hypothetical protein
MAGQHALLAPADIKTAQSDTSCLLRRRIVYRCIGKAVEQLAQPAAVCWLLVRKPLCQKTN